jgi:hypothetical protein
MQDFSQFASIAGRKLAHYSLKDGAGSLKQESLSRREAQADIER